MDQDKEQDVCASRSLDKHNFTDFIFLSVYFRTPNFCSGQVRPFSSVGTFHMSDLDIVDEVSKANKK